MEEGRGERQECGTCHVHMHATKRGQRSKKESK